MPRFTYDIMHWEDFRHASESIADLRSGSSSEVQLYADDTR